MKTLTFAISAAMAMHLHMLNAGTNAFVSGTSFEKYLHGHPARSLVAFSGDDGYYAEEFYWHFDDSEGTYIVTNVGAGVRMPFGVSRPSIYADSPDTNILMIENQFSHLLRTVHKASDINRVKPVNVKNGDIVADMVVKMYSRQEPPGFSLGHDKLKVWIYATESLTDDEPRYLEERDAPVTNLIVSAGHYDRESGCVVDVRDYVAINVNVTPGEWHRLTIASGKKLVDRYGRVGDKYVYEEFYVPVFRVYIDGVLVHAISMDGCEIVDEFYSFTDHRYEYGWDLKGVAFKGDCLLDDIVFSTQDPFSFPVEVAVHDHEGISYESKYYVDGESGAAYEYFSPDILWLPNDARSVTFVHEVDVYGQIEGGIPLGKITPYTYLWSKTVPVDKTTRSIVVNVKCWPYEFVEAEERPTLDGEECYNVDLMLKANSSSVIYLPLNEIYEWSVNDNVLMFRGEHYAKFAEYYSLNIIGSQLTLSLNRLAHPRISEKGGFVLEGDTVRIHIVNLIPNLYYGVKTMSAHGDMEDVVWAREPGVVPAVKKPSGNSGFFQVTVSDIAPE